MENIKGVLVNDGGSKVRYTWEEFDKKYPNKEPYESVAILNGKHHREMEIIIYTTEALLYNVQEDMFYYVLGDPPFNCQVVPHNHPGIYNGYLGAEEALKREYKSHEGELHLTWIENGRKYKKQV